MLNDDYALHDQAKIKASKQAADYVTALNIPTTIELPEKIDTLGLGVKKYYDRKITELKSEFQDSFGRQISVALTWYFYSCSEAAFYVGSCSENGFMLDNEHTKKIATPEGYALNEGMAYTLYNKIAETSINCELMELLQNLPFDLKKSKDAVLSSISLYWINEAEKARKLGESENSYNLLYEALDAYNLDSGIYMYDSGVENTIEDARSQLGAHGAKMLHQETYRLRDEVIKFWHDNIDKKLSNEKAAQILTRQFPLSHRKISEYISSEKKRLSAGKT